MNEWLKEAAHFEILKNYTVYLKNPCKNVNNVLGEG